MIQNTDLETIYPEFQLWLQTEPHLPKIEPIILKAFIKYCDGDLEKAKKHLNFHYNLRNSYPNIFFDRNFSDTILQSIFQTCDIIPLPKRTADGNRISLLRLADFDVDKMYFTEAIKLFFMIADMLISTADDDGLPNKEILVLDMNGFNLAYLKKINFTALKGFATMIQEGFCVKIHSVHVLNTASYIDKIMFIVKPFIKKEFLKLIQFHLPNSDTIYSTLSKELLPIDYGGSNGLIKDLKNELYESVNEKNGYLNDMAYWKICGKKHSEKLKLQQSDIIEGNFKTLDID